MTQVRKEYLRWIVVKLWLEQTPNETLAAFKMRVLTMLRGMTQESVDMFRNEARVDLFSGTIPEDKVKAALATYDALKTGGQTPPGEFVNVIA